MTGIAFVKVGKTVVKFKSKKDKWGDLEVRISPKDLLAVKEYASVLEEKRQLEEKITKLEEELTVVKMSPYTIVPTPHTKFDMSEDKESILQRFKRYISSLQSKKA